jgi:transcriptional regulator with XRE-family HTH domain
MLNRLLLSIELVMKEQGLTQSRLAELIGMEQPQLSAILSGKNSPTLGTIARIAFALGDEHLLQFPHHERKIAELAKKKRQAIQRQR